MPDGRNPSDLINYLYKTACNTSYCCGYLKGTIKGVCIGGLIATSVIVIRQKFRRVNNKPKVMTYEEYYNRSRS